ncbi:MAG: Hpt domain-containing protein [Pyrinomonadaceae bacterium]|nr:Hpt domain-containing protein [Pyrinomonadaceae bacterium]
MARHTLKGSIANFGAAPACDLAYELELMSREGNLAGSDSVLTA